jgi:uncharacterized membrane protein YfcA
MALVVQVVAGLTVVGIVLFPCMYLLGPVAGVLAAALIWSAVGVAAWYVSRRTVGPRPLLLLLFVVLVFSGLGHLLRWMYRAYHNLSLQNHRKKSG